MYSVKDNRYRGQFITVRDLQEIGYIKFAVGDNGKYLLYNNVEKHKIVKLEAKKNGIDLIVMEEYSLI